MKYSKSICPALGSHRGSFATRILTLHTGSSFKKHAVYNLSTRGRSRWLSSEGPQPSSSFSPPGNPRSISDARPKPSSPSLECAEGPRRRYVISIDYTREDCRFPVSESCVTISNTKLLSSSEAGVNLGIGSWKSTYLIELKVRKHWWYLFHKEVKSWESTTWFRIWQFQTPAWNRYLQTHLVADERFVFWGVMIGVFWKRDPRAFKWPNSSCLHICSPRLYPKERTYLRVYI